MFPWGYSGRPWKLGYRAGGWGGWNPCVGLGSPKGRALLEALEKLIDTTTA